MPLPQKATQALARSRSLRFLLLTFVFAAVLTMLNWGGESAGLIVQFDLESTGSEGSVAVYYHGGSGFAEATSVKQPLRAGLHHYEFRLPVARTAGLRIDPSMNDGATLIRDVAARRGPTVIKRFDAAALAPGNDIVEWHVEEGGRALRFTVQPGGTDPFFVVRDSALEVPGMAIDRFAAIVFVAALAAAGVLFLLLVGPSTGPPAPALPIAALGLALGLILAFAFLASTTVSRNPDEFDHMRAARYYMEHWVPPAVGAPASLPAYSAYGASYLNEPDIVYLVAAKFAACLGFTGLHDYVRLRLFNVALLAFCGLVALRSRLARIAMLPLLCSAQVWYVFGYFNAEAIALMSTTLLATAVAEWFERSEEAGGAAPGEPVAWIVAIGALVALCLLSKRTFYPFLPFIGGYALWRSGLRARVPYVLAAAGLALLAFWYYARPQFQSVGGLVDSAAARGTLVLCAFALIVAALWLGMRRRTPLPRVLVVAAALGVAIFAARWGIDVAINGMPWEKSRALTALAERISYPEFRPSILGTPASYHGVALAARGVSLSQLVFGDYAWLSQVEDSFFGTYGYMTIWAPLWLYRGQHLFAALLLAAIAAGCMRDRSSRVVLGLGAAAIFLMFELALLHSWVSDLQAQGRYLFAVLPVVGVLLVECERRADAGLHRPELRVAHGSIAVLWALAVMSYAAVCLPALARP